MSSHSELFGLKGQKEPGFPKEVTGAREGAGTLGGAKHPTGDASSGENYNVADENNPGRAGEEGTVGGMKQGTGDNTVPGAGSSLMPNQGSGEVAPEQHSTADILNPTK